MTTENTTPAPAVGPPCSKCGKPTPDPTPELRALAAQAGIPLAVDHDTCPGDKPDTPTRFFSVVVVITDGTVDGPTLDAEPYLRFSHTVGAENLDAAMRPLAEGLGQQWMKAEKRANLADGLVQ